MSHRFLSSLLGALVLTLPALAAAQSVFLPYLPRVGDYAVIRDSNGYTSKTRVAAFNDERDTYQIVTTAVRADGREVPRGSVNRLGEGLRRTFFADVEGFCQDQAGVLEKITVPAGEFSACRLDENTELRLSSTWYAAWVPFGRIRIASVNRDGSQAFSVELIEFGPQPAP